MIVDLYLHERYSKDVVVEEIVLIDTILGILGDGYDVLSINANAGIDSEGEYHESNYEICKI